MAFTPGLGGEASTSSLQRAFLLSLPRTEDLYKGDLRRPPGIPNSPIPSLQYDDPQKTDVVNRLVRDPKFGGYFLSADWAEFLYDQVFISNSQPDANITEPSKVSATSSVPSVTSYATAAEEKNAIKPEEAEESADAATEEGVAKLTIGEPFIIDIDDFTDVEVPPEPPIPRDAEADLAWQWANLDNDYAGWSTRPWTPSDLAVDHSTAEKLEYSDSWPVYSSSDAHPTAVSMSDVPWETPRYPARLNTPASEPIQGSSNRLHLQNQFGVLALEEDHGPSKAVESVSPSLPLCYAPSNSICFSPNIFVAPEQTVAPSAPTEGKSSHNSKVHEGPKLYRSSNRRGKKSKNDHAKDWRKSRPLVPVVEIVAVKGQMASSKPKAEPKGTKNIASHEKSIKVEPAKVSNESSASSATEALRLELEMLKKRGRENEYLCSLRHEEVSEKTKEVEDAIAFQKRQEGEIARLIETLERAIEVNEERGRVLDRAIKVVEETCERQTSFGETIRRVEDLEEQLVNLIRLAEEKIKAEEFGGASELKRTISQLDFRVDILADTHAALTRSFDHASRIVGLGKAVPITTSVEPPPREVIAAVTRHWALHILAAAKPVLDDTCNLRTCEDLIDTIHNTATASSAVATLLRVVLGMLAHTANIAFAHDPDPTQGPRSALRLFSVLYPVVRRSLVNIARLTGPWCRDAYDRCQATTQLKELLDKMVHDAAIDKACVVSGEPFSGLSHTPRDRWLPTVRYGENFDEAPFILLSTPPAESLNDLDTLTCRTPAITSWQGFFARKYPSLLFDATPLFVTPLFPSLSSDDLGQVQDIAQDVEQAPLTGVDAVDFIVSWIGRALLRASDHEDEDASLHCAVFALAMYPDLRSDLCNAIDVSLCKELAHGVLGLPAKLGPAAHFIGSVLHHLIAISGATARYVVVRGDTNAFNKIGANYWLPRVETNMATCACPLVLPTPCFIDLTADEGD